MTHREGGVRAAILAGLLLYVALLSASPVLHHDFECHVKTPGHCPACLASPVASGAESGASLGTPASFVADLVLRPPAADPRAPSPTLRSGRSPPA